MCSPQAILLDILLPGKDAWEFLAILKSEDATKDIPVLVATTVEDQRKGFALGADAYVSNRSSATGSSRNSPG